ncbi:MAG: MOSC N-terminal beta barrel domain-containing protein [Burkholderiales bacterium]
MPTATLPSLHLYPVKGCRGIDIASATVAVTGLAHDGVGDREWMLVDRDGRFVTQREHPRLALVQVAIHDGALTFTTPDSRPLRVAPPAADAPSREVVVWHSQVLGRDAGNAAAQMLSTWLGLDVRLVRFDRTRARPCNPEYAGDSGAHTFFADGYPLLVIGESSLAELNERMAARGEPALPMNRFRPNLVVRGLPPFAEDHLSTLRIGDVELTPVKPCVRCQVTTTDQATAAVGIEPLRTLGGFRMDERFGGVTFGMNAVVTAGAGARIASGDTVTADYRF